MAKIDITQEALSEMKNLVVNELIVSGWQEECIKKYLASLYVICSKTHNEDYMNFYNSVKDFFGNEFRSDIVGIVQSWITSGKGLANYARAQGQDSYSIEYVTETEYKLREEISSIKFNNINETGNNSGSVTSYSDDEITAEIISVDNKMGEDLRRTVRNALSECDSRVSQNVMYESIKDLIEGLSKYADGFDSVTNVKDLSSFIADKRKAALASRGIRDSAKKVTKIKLNLKKK